MTTCWRSFGGTRFELSAPAQLAQTARRWLGDGGWRPGGAPPGAIRIRLERAGDGLRCRAPALGDPLEGAPEAVLSELEYECVCAALARARRPAALHAAVIDTPLGGVLLVGEHAAGKTTLGLALAARGGALRGDDIALVGLRGRVAPLPRPLRVRMTSLSLLPALAPAIRRSGVHDPLEALYRVSPAALGATRTGTSAIAHIVFARYAAGARPRLQPMPSAETVPALLSHTFDVRARDPGTARAIVELARSAGGWRFGYGESPRAAAARLLEALSP